MTSSFDDALREAFASVQAPDSLVEETVARAEMRPQENMGEVTHVGASASKPAAFGRMIAFSDGSADAAQVEARSHAAKNHKRSFRHVRAFRVAATLAACLACGAVGVGGYAWASVDALVQVDVNPSVELALNRFDVVVAAKGLNEDGAQLLSSCEVKGKTYDEALRVLLRSDALASFANETTNTEALDVAVSVVCKNERRCASLEMRAEESVGESLCGGRQLRYRKGHDQQPSEHAEEADEAAQNAESQSCEEEQNCSENEVSPGHQGNGHGEKHRGEGNGGKNFKNFENNA